jgi:hypothetical protein
VTCDTWHVTHDMWHMTCDTWHLTHDRSGEVELLSKFQLPSSYRTDGTVGSDPVSTSLTYRQFRKRMSHSINQWINYEGVYRTAPATPGLSKIERLGSFQLAWHSVTPCDTTFRGFIGTFPKNYFSSYFSWTGPNGNISPSATAVLKQLWAQPL